MTTILEKPTVIDGPISNTDTFEKLLSVWEGIEWIEELKKNAWKDYSDMPMPTGKDESWRYSKLPKFDIAEDNIRAPRVTVPTPEVLPFDIEGAAKLVFTDDYPVIKPELPQELADKGVIFTTLREAIVEHEAIVKEKLFSNEMDLGSSKFQALIKALFRNGTFIYVPKNVEVDVPLLTNHWTTSEKSVLFPVTLIVAEANSKVTHYEYLSNGSDACSTFFGNAQVFAADGAKVQRVYVQNLDDRCVAFQSDDHHAGRDADIKMVAVNLGCEFARLEARANMEAKGSNVDLRSLTAASGKQRFDQRTLQVHKAEHTTSDLLFKNTLLDKSRTIFSGLIFVEDEAQHTDSYQTNRNLLLSDDAEATAMPGLEISANDVKCSHGATSGRLDDSDLFYMLSRGISKEAAKKLLVFGFLEEILDSIGDEKVAEQLRDLVQHKFDNAKVDA